jgi:hypothetical protein
MRDNSFHATAARFTQSCSYTATRNIWESTRRF